MKKLPSIIVDNQSRCPHCKSELPLRVSDVDVAIIDGEKHFEMEVRCLKCSGKSYYFLDLDMIERKSVDKKSDRFSRVDSEEKEEIIMEDIEDEM